MPSFELGTIGMQSGSTELLAAAFGINGVTLWRQMHCHDTAALLCLTSIVCQFIYRPQARRLLAECMDIAGFGSTHGF